MELEELLQYVVLEKGDIKESEKSFPSEDLLPSLLEKKIARPSSRKPASSDRRVPSRSLEENVGDENGEMTKEESSHDKAHITYDLFIPAEQISYAALEIEYAVSSKKETLLISAEQEGREFSTEVSKPWSEIGDYSIRMKYDAKRKGYHVQYSTNAYKEQLEIARQDFALKLDKFLDIMPESLMGGVLGFTYLGSGKIARRADLFGDMAKMVDVHESIHTPDEYETRVLTDWILKIEPPKYRN
jgi:hypothetical protein